MTDHLTQLLQTVLENPADDGPRLVCADWCEEHGQGERAEYIRIGCELAAMGEPPIILGALYAFDFVGAGQFKCERVFARGDRKPKIGDRCYAQVVGRDGELIKRLYNLFVKKLEDDVDEYHSTRLLLKPIGENVKWPKKRYASLCRRTAELLTQHEPDWVRLELGMELLIRNADGSAHYLDSRGWDQTKHPVKFHWHRGFVSQAECTLETWRGRTCNPLKYDPKKRTLIKCPTCHGTGRTPGIGPKLVRRAPVEAVVMTDKRPKDLTIQHAHDFAFCYSNESFNEGPTSPYDLESQLPNDIWQNLDGVKRRSGFHRTWHIFPSAAAANAALSAALLQEARETPLTDVKEKVYS